jgi:hypothetical protein
MQTGEETEAWFAVEPTGPATPLLRRLQGLCNHAVAGWTIVSASRAVDNPRNRPTNINRSMLPKRSLFAAVRRRICWRSAKFSATRATLNRKSPMNAHQINVQMSNIERQHAHVATTC